MDTLLRARVTTRGLSGTWWQVLASWCDRPVHVQAELLGYWEYPGVGGEGDGRGGRCTSSTPSAADCWISGVCFRVITRSHLSPCKSHTHNSLYGEPGCSVRAARSAASLTPLQPHSLCLQDTQSWVPLTVS